MPSIVTVKRLVKRVIVANLATNKRDLYLTPLISGKHGIGKSQIVKAIAADVGGVCYTIEGGTLKEGEITGIPYQYVDEEGDIHFRFLPYYVIEKVQKQEKEYNKINPNLNDDNLSPVEKINLIYKKEIKPCIIFIDEINRTDNAVYRELMNILLTRIVNGYKLPWWVFFVAAMNPSSEDSVYQTNEMDPAQLDRFFKIEAVENLQEWITYAKKNDIEPAIMEFIKSNGSFLTSNETIIDEFSEGTPSPRSWDMIDTIIKSRKITKILFTKEENMHVSKDIKMLIQAKVGQKIALMFYQFLEQVQVYLIDEFLDDDYNLTDFLNVKKDITTSGYAVLINNITRYLKQNIHIIATNDNEYFNLIHKINILLKNIDKSTALLFIQNVINEQDINGNILFLNIKNVFDDELLEMLNLTMNSINKLKVK